MRNLIYFLASTSGRILRMTAGIVLILVGTLVLEGAVGWVVAAIGLVPLSAGLSDRCIIAVPFGFPFSGAKVRAMHRGA